MRLLLAALTSCALIGLGASGAQASSSVRYGIQDDSWLIHGAGTLDDRLDRIESLGVEIVRFNLHWDRIEPVRGEQNWEESDMVLEGLHDRGIPAVVGIVGSPRWANGGRTPNFAPGAAAFAEFASTAASRYSWVNQWLVWNEPNQARWLRPTTPAVYVRQLLNPAYKAIHAANPRAKVGGGVTAPRGSTAGVSPVNWIRGMRKAGARLDAYAHHPYPVDQSRVAVRQRQLQVLHDDHDGHPRAAALGGEPRVRPEEDLADRVRLPDRRVRSHAAAAGGADRRVRDARAEGSAGRHADPLPRQGRAGGGALPERLVPELGTSEAFRTRLPVPDRAGRPQRREPRPLGSDPAPLGCTDLPGAGSYTGAWRFSGGMRKTSARGFFSVAVPAAPGARVRIYSPQDEAYSISIRAH